MPRFPAPAARGDKGLAHPALRLFQRPRDGFWTIRFDGSCADNGSAFASGKWGFLILDAAGRPVRRKSGDTVAAAVTNNVSEWRSVAEAVREIEAGPRPTGLLFEGDSRLVVEQLTGAWASKKAELTAIRDEVRDALARVGLPWAAKWIPREENSEADELTRPETPIEDWSAWPEAEETVIEEPEPTPATAPPTTPAKEQASELTTAGDPARLRLFLVVARSAAEARALTGAGDGDRVEEVTLTAAKVLLSVGGVG
ncbi:reverse transcriptase-like protein [Limnoglobus roseus]|uniref:Ribonuclease H n=1 Tax=Limnoglobus roseus TaxID=2598579 RepID=A0A5C1AFD3_9BACT|nr:reverse transcriptase-like protein [Limnoglobus roseus]QEL16933.1 ribonuclease H [Limnoglobus roseus]